jgi:hypothetical protein
LLTYNILEDVLHSHRSITSGDQVDGRDLKMYIATAIYLDDEKKLEIYISKGRLNNTDSSSR